MFICFVGAREWCDHWKQCVWFTPEKGLRVCTDEAVQLRAIHTDTSISYDFGTQSCLKEVGYQQCAARIQKSQIALPPERMAIYGDNSWRCSFIKVLSNAVSSLTSQKNKKKVLNWRTYSGVQMNNMVNRVFNVLLISNLHFLLCSCEKRFLLYVLLQTIAFS